MTETVSFEKRPCTFMRDDGIIRVMVWQESPMRPPRRSKAHPRTLADGHHDPGLGRPGSTAPRHVGVLVPPVPFTQRR